jgi:hypothetical protein
VPPDELWEELPLDTDPEPEEWALTDLEEPELLRVANELPLFCVACGTMDLLTEVLTG